MVSKPGPPLLEILLVLVAVVLLFVVFILWWFFGYMYVLEEHAEMLFNTMSSTSTTLLSL